MSRIEEATTGDAQEVIQYFKVVADETSFLSFGSTEFNKTVEVERKIIAQHREAENQLFILAKIQEKIAGILTVSANQKMRMKHKGEVGISVLQAYWGQGIGTTLMEYMIAWAKSNGMTRKLNLYVAVNNTTAIGLYKKMGFVEEGKMRRDSLINGDFVDCYCMGLLID
ncbi:MAG: GNAT family N-acetyltransferase [Bacteroidota bacterium]